MKCQSCGERPAVIHFKEVVDGRSQEMHLCESCADDKGFHLVIEQNKLSLVNQFVWMAENLYPESAAKVGAVQCERCGIRFSTFARTGRLGCPKCYEAFASQMPTILRRIHGATRHKGRGPAGLPPATSGERTVERLRIELARAIEREEFERAAEIRDDLRQLEARTGDDA